MPGTPTPNLALIVPTVGGDANVWGNELNTDLSILDGLGVGPNVVHTGNFTVVPSIYPETIYQATTGGSNGTATLPAANTATGKYLTFKKMDSGAGALVISGSIDGGSSWTIAAQFGYVRLYCDGSVYNVVGNS